MDVTAIQTFIGTVGFPIAMSCALFWYMVKEGRENRTVVENNTKMLSRILEHLVEDEKRHMNDDAK